MGKKKKSQDFQKVKLKVGRRLPKGLNVTDTSFSTRKIILREQLKDESTAGPTTHRKLGLKDLLSRLDHYNQSTRCESLVGLKELFSTNPSLIKSHLSTILEKTCPKIIDRDGSVRKAVLGVLNLILKNVDSTQLSPFFPVLSSCLCCAMTHIVMGIRFDSLLFLDLLLETFPDLTVMTGNQIFQNFLNQISTERDTQSAKVGRMLLVNPSEKLTSQRWRTKVLRRMERFLRASLDLWDPPQEERSEEKVVVWDSMNTAGVTLYLGGGSKPQLANVFSLHHFDVSVEGTVQVKNPDVLKNFISVLIPLLIETWVEASPSMVVTVRQDTDPCNTMDCVLQVVKLLGECAEKISKDNLTLNWFREVLAGDFQKHFMAWFPYSEVKSPPRKRRNIDCDEVRVSHVRLNITVCEIFTLLAPNIELETRNIFHERICDYLGQAFVDNELRGVDNVEAVIKVVRRLLTNGEVSEKLLETLWQLSRYLPPGRRDQSMIVDFFVEIVSGIQHHHLITCSALSSWLRTLPREIILASKFTNVLGPLLKKVWKFAVRGYQPFLEGLQENDTEFIELLSSTIDEEDRHHLVVLCSHLPKFSLQTFRSLASALRSSKITVHNVSFLLQALHSRLCYKTDPGFDVCEYLGFLQCVIIGVFKSEENALREEYESTNKSCHLRQFLPSVSRFTLVPSEAFKFERHSLIIEEVLKVLLQFPNMNCLEKSVYTYISCLLESLSHLPVHSVVAIMRTVTAVHTVCNSEDEDIDVLLEKLHSILAPLTVDTLFTCSCLHIVGQDDRILEDLQESVLNFIQISDFGPVVSELLFKQRQDQGSISPEEAECLGGVLLQLLRSGVLDARSIRMIATIVRNLRHEVDIDGSEIWWKDLLYEFQRQTSRHKSLH